MRLYGLLAALLLIASSAFGAGKIEGIITDEKKSEPLIGATVLVQGTQSGSSTDIDGRFQVSVAAGTYTIVVSYTGYQTKEISEITVTEGGVTPINIAISEKTKKTELGEVTVKATRRQESIASLVAFQKNTNTVAQVVSAEAIRKSPDKSAGDALKRVSGASIQDGKYLVVRGLADRYNAAMLNGALLSSSEPDRKTFSFDLFPANVIENIIINKAAVPELPGEFAGGLIQINTRDIPAENFFTLQLGTGGNTQTLGKDFKTNNVGGTDFLGIDDGARGLIKSFPGSKNDYETAPADARVALSRQFPNNWNIDTKSAPLNVGGQATGGYVRNIGKGRFGFIGSLNYSKNNRYVETLREDFTLDGTDQNSFNDKRYNQDITWGALGNFAYSIGKSKFTFKNLYNIQASNNVTLRDGHDFANDNDQQAYEMAFITNRIYSSQLGGEHLLEGIGGIKMNWNLNYTNLGQSTPDLRRLSYQSPTGENNYSANIASGAASFTSSGRFFSELNDNVYGGNLNLSKAIKIAGVTQTIKAGYLYQMKDRSFAPRIFGYKGNYANPLVSNPSTGDDIIHQPYDQIFRAENMGVNLLTLDEVTNAQDRYEAGSMLNAGYLQFDNTLWNNIQVSWGARLENYHQEVRYNVSSTTGAKAESDVLDFLPSANAKYALNEKTNIRLSGSQTVIRPEFRELAPFSFYNFELLASESGSPNLQRTKVTNVDLRYELYPTAGEFATVGVFYKYFANPIERFYNTTGGGTQSLVYGNTPSAQSAGIELEFRKSLGFIRHDADKNNFWNNFYVFANGAYIYNRVKFEAGSSLKERPMQGQSDYVINGGVSADVPKSGTNMSLLVNRIGRRIFFVGDAVNQPNVWEAPRTMLDFQITQRFLRNGEIKLAVSDILNQYARFYEDINENGRYDERSGANGDFLRIRSRYGTNFSLSVAYKLPVKRVRAAEGVTNP
jgi:TonB-dependent receptor